MNTPWRWQAALLSLVLLVLLLPAVSAASCQFAPAVPLTVTASADSTWEDAKEKIGTFFNSRDRVIQVAAVAFLIGIFIIMRGKPGT